MTLKQYQAPLNEDDVFISLSTEHVTWKNLHNMLDEKIEILKKHGLGPHVVFVVAEEVKTLDDMLWILASIKNGGSASQASADQSNIELDSLIGDSNARCVIRSNKIKMLHEPDSEGKIPSTLLHPNEMYRGMTSGTTVKPIFELWPFFWDYEDHAQANVNGETLRGCTMGSMTGHLKEVSPELFNNKRPIMLQNGGFESTYLVWNLARAYYTGGTIHFINETVDNIPEQFQKVKPNLVASYPNAVKRLLDACPDDFDFEVDYWEFAGGHTGENIIRDIEKKFKWKVIYNVMASTEADCHTRSEYRPGDSLDNFYGFYKTYYWGELKVDDGGVLWYKYGLNDWMTDGDKMKIANGKWYYDGRVFDDVIFMKDGVKVYTGLVEAQALLEPGVNEVSSCSRDEIHYVIYTGSADINNLAKRFEELQKYKRPHNIYHVTEKLYYGGKTKHQKSKLVSLLDDFPNEIISTLSIKPHSEI